MSLTKIAGVECIELAEQMSFNLGTAMEFIWSHHSRGQQVHDLQKARWYIQREIERLKKQGQS